MSQPANPALSALLLAIGALIGGPIFGYLFWEIWQLISPNLTLSWASAIIGYLYGFGGGIAQVKVGYRGVLLIFGAPIPLFLPEGFTWTLPRPFMSLRMVDVRERTLKPDGAKSGEDVLELDEVLAQPTTTEEAVIPLRISVFGQYRVVDPLAYIRVDDPEKALTSLTDRSVRVMAALRKATQIPGMTEELSDILFAEVQEHMGDWGFALLANWRVERVRLPTEIEAAASNQETERYQTEAEEIEIRNFVARVDQVIASGITPDKAIDVVQAERKKATRIVIDGGASDLVKAGALAGGHGRNQT